MVVAVLLASFAVVPHRTASAVTNLALGKTASSSSSENSTFLPGNAVDGNGGTRWSSGWSDPQWIRIDLGATANISRVVLRWEAAYGRSYQIQVSDDGSNWTTIYSTSSGDGGVDDLALTGSGRHIRMYGTARGTPYGYSLWEFEVFGESSSESSNLALAKPATVSSAESSSLAASYAVDGNASTRWSSGWSDPQWIRIDLGATANISRVVLRWEAAYGRSYQIQVSDDGSNWTTIYSTTSGDGGVDDLTLTGSGRFIRMYGTARGTPYGYSIWEFEVYGSSSPDRSCSSVSNIALNKPAYTWFYESTERTPEMAVDGNTTTRWSHQWYPSGPATAWLYVDLGSTSATITRVKINWEAALAADFAIQTSNDRTSWTTVRSVSGNASLTNDYSFSPAVTGRYLRINMTRKGSDYGYSIWELEVYGCNAGNPTKDADPAPLSGTYQLVWSDHFDGNALNLNNWAYDNDVHVNNEVQQYTSSNVSVSNGTLKLTARKERVNGYDFTSGRIYTRGLRDWTYGRFAARMKLPVGEGYWPAFWMLGSNIDLVGWPATGEIDIMENIGYADWVSGALHGPGYWGAGSAGGNHNLPAGQSISDWHLYSVEWDPTYIRWYIDGSLVRTFTRSDIVDNYGQWTYDDPKFLILNLALGGDYPQGYNGVTSPYYGLPQATVDKIVAGNGVVEVDYVEVYQKR